MAFTLHEGGLSQSFNIYNDYKFEECFATNTRLMGVVSMRLSWISKADPDKHLHQLIHLDYSEYGIDEYHEFIEERNKRIFPLIGDEIDMFYVWDKMSSCLGGVEKKISLDHALDFICSSILIGRMHYNSHVPEIKRFHSFSVRRINFMLSSLGFPDFESFEIDSSDYMLSLIPDNMTQIETVNYFIMRLMDRDFTAASLLSDFHSDSLSKEKMMSGLGILALMRNRVERSPLLKNEGKNGTMYSCRSLLLGKDYYYSISELGLRKSSSYIKYKINYFKINFISRISAFEAALQLRQREYITTFKINGSQKDFNPQEIFVFFKGLPYKVSCGILYMIYNTNNLHVRDDDYYMGHDVYGVILITDYGELVVMSSDITRIDMLEKVILSSPQALNLELLDRYRFENQIFQSFSKSNGMSFEEFLDEYE